MAALNEAGAQWSADPKRKARQMKVVEKQLEKLNFKFDDKGVPLLLDKEGQRMRNQETADDLVFSDYIIANSPVDFKTQEQRKAEKNTPTPNNPSGGNTNNHGFSAEQLKKLSIKDFNEAKNEGLTEKANFIKCIFFLSAAILVHLFFNKISLFC